LFDGCFLGFGELHVGGLDEGGMSLGDADQWKRGGGK
jgi:hypothetical protein